VVFSDIMESGEVLDLANLRVKSPARTARVVPLLDASEWRTRRSRCAQVAQKKSFVPAIVNSMLLLAGVHP
jgi:hypothetical protein